MDGEISRDVFLRRLKQNVAALREPPSLGNPRVGLPGCSSEQLASLKEQRVKTCTAQFTAQLQADLQRVRTQYTDVLRADPTPSGSITAPGEEPLLAAQPRSDVDARRYVTAPLLSLFHILMRRQRVANRLRCLDDNRTQQRKLERAAVSTATETEVPCCVTGNGPFVLLPPSDKFAESATVASGTADAAASSGVDMPNHHFVSLRPPQPLRKPLVFQQAHYRVEPFPEFCVDVRGQSEKELDVYRSTHVVASEVPCLQHFSQPLVTLETFAPTTTCNFCPANVYGTSEYRPHQLTTANGSLDYNGDIQTGVTAHTQAEAYLAPSAITVAANLSSVPPKPLSGCPEDSVSDEDEDCVTQQCSFKMNPSWLPPTEDVARLGMTEALATTMAPPSTFVSFLDKFT